MGYRWVHQAGEGEFRFLLIVGGERETAVLKSRVFAEGHLEGAQRPGQGDCSAHQHKTPQIYIRLLHKLLVIAPADGAGAR